MASREQPFVVYVDMVADMFHAGHIVFLRKARALGVERAGGRPVRVVVGIHDDDTAASYKRRPVWPLAERVIVVGACREVDEVIPGAPLRVTHSYLEQVDADLVVHGDDFDPATIDAFYGPAIELGIFATVPYTHTVDGEQPISTSAVIVRVQARPAAG